MIGATLTEPPADNAHPASAGSSGASTLSSERFKSILFGDAEQVSSSFREAPEFFRDLNLAQIVESITAGRERYDLAPFFHTPLPDLDAVAYRQEVFRDVEDESLARSLGAFAQRLRSVRSHLEPARSRPFLREKQRWFLAAAEVYCEAVEGLSRDLDPARLRSRGMRAFFDSLTTYIRSPAFARLAADARNVALALDAIRYAILLNDGTVTVRRFEGESDYTAAVEATFEKFRRDTADDHLIKFADPSGLNHIEAQIVDRVALLHPEPFRALEAFCRDHVDFVDDTIARFDREIQFYLAYVDHTCTLRRAGLSFCYPKLSDSDKTIDCREAYDLALAGKLVSEKRAVVANDFFLRGRERILVVSGPNNGGKTTFARMFGQMLYLAALGCPVPGRSARLFLVDQLFAHFEREEDVANLRGKLEDDLLRIRAILDRASSNSVVVMNEVFASTALKDALNLGSRVMERLSDIDCLAVCVTFLDELASFNQKTVSMVSGVDPSDPAIRTYKIERRPADGLAYALAVAEKHGVTYAHLKDRIRE